MATQAIDNWQTRAQKSYAAKQQLINRLQHKSAINQQQFYRKKAMMPPPHMVRVWTNNSTITTATMTMGAYTNQNFFITTAVTPTTTNMLQYYPNQTATTAPSVWSNVLIDTVDTTNDIECPNDPMDSETYAVRHVVDFLNRNCLSVSEFASKAFGDKALTLDSGTYKLPGGAVLTVNKDRSYHIDDSNHKTTYAANPIRDWNEFINTSDVLDKFMQYIANLNITKEQFLELPIRLFLLWLIIEAARKDKEPVPEAEQLQLELALEPLKVRAINHEVTLNVSSPTKVAHAVAK